MAKPYSTFIINVCHLQLGHRCLGCYIREYWVVTLHECAWSITQFHHTRMVADNPTLDCVGGQYRDALAIYLHPRTSLTHQRIALVKLERPFILDRGVSMVNVGKPRKSYKSCTVYKCGRDERRRRKSQLYPIHAQLTEIEKCESLFNYSFFAPRRLMTCGDTKEELSHTEMIRFSGISPLVCHGRLKGFVIAANHTTIGILRILYDTDWIETLTGSYKFITTNAVKLILNLKLFFIIITFIVLLLQ